MKSMILVALALVAVAAAAPTETPQIITFGNYQDPEGGYNFDFETDDGVKRQEAGTVQEALDEENKPHSVVTVRGTYSYTNPDGQLEEITYYADESGFHAEGKSIPKVASR